MFIKLTHKGRPTLINTENVINFYHDNDVKQQKRLVKLTFVNGSVVFVDEELEEVFEIIQGVSRGEKQAIDWTIQPPSIEDRMEESFSSYSGPSYRPRRRMYQEREYNRY